MNFDADVNGNHRDFSGFLVGEPARVHDESQRPSGRRPLLIIFVRSFARAGAAPMLYGIATYAWCSQ
jgi:hypothetical protein